MDFWQRARSFAEEATKKSHELTQGIASTNFSEVLSEASKRSKELAAEASKKSKELAAEALKRADQISAQIPPAASALTNLVDDTPKQAGIDAADLEKYGVTDDLREFVKGITKNTFKDFPLEDDSEISDIPTVSNVQKDLNEWQEKHAKLVLLIVKEISKLRYQLCPQVMRERKFWRIYFILVNSHIELYEKRYMEDARHKDSEKHSDTEAKNVPSGETSRTGNDSLKLNSSNVKPAASDQDLDVFLLGDLEDGDDGPDNGDGGDDGLDDDF